MPIQCPSVSQERLRTIIYKGYTYNATARYKPSIWPVVGLLLCVVKCGGLIPHDVGTVDRG